MCLHVQFGATFLNMAYVKQFTWLLHGKTVKDVKNRCIFYLLQKVCDGDQCLFGDSVTEVK